MKSDRIKFAFLGYLGFAANFIVSLPTAVFLAFIGGWIVAISGQKASTIPAALTLATMWIPACALMGYITPRLLALPFKASGPAAATRLALGGIAYWSVFSLLLGLAALSTPYETIPLILAALANIAAQILSLKTLTGAKP